MSTTTTKHAHPRDQNISFDEASHIYTIKGSSKGYISVTKFLGSFHGKFDADKVIQGMKASPKWPQSPYFGMSDADIKKQWSDSGTQASTAGTALHLTIEEFLEGQPITNRNVLDSKEWSYFLSFWNCHKAELEPYRLEWSVFSEEWKIAGQIDAVFRRKRDGAFFIYDWKRVKDIKYENPFQSCFDPVGHLPDTNYWHYTLQLNLYRHLLETYYGMKIEGMYLIVFHPDFPTYRKLRLNRLEQELEDLVRTRAYSESSATSSGR
jgi:hypothetical protein